MKYRKYIKTAGSDALLSILRSDAFNYYGLERRARVARGTVGYAIRGTRELSDNSRRKLVKALKDLAVKIESI